MPKIVSRSAVSASTDAAPTESSVAALKVYYCLCGEFVLVIDKDLKLLPRRKTDGAIILRSQDAGSAKARAFKFNVNMTGPIFVQRSQSHERQYRFHCTRCTLPIGYQMTPPPLKSGPFVYLNYGAVTQQQGYVPPEAFDGENDTYIEREALNQASASKVASLSSIS